MKHVLTFFAIVIMIILPGRAMAQEDTCYTSLDVNGDGQVNIGDGIFINNFFFSGGPPPDPAYVADYNADGYLDIQDYSRYTCITNFGWFECGYDHWPVAVPCLTVTEFGACCSGDSCLLLAEGNCLNLGGTFLGNGVSCESCTDTCFGQYPRDANADGNIDGADVQYLVSYLYDNGPAPVPLANGDANGNCCISKADIDYLEAYLNSGGPAPVECTCQEPIKCDCVPADANWIPGPFPPVINVGDAVYLLNVIFGDATLPDACHGDANCDCGINVGDAVYVINFVFKGGPPPCDCCEWINNCGLPLER